MKTLDDRVAFVTGGRGGIGWAISQRFVREGARVFVGDLTESGSLVTIRASLALVGFPRPPGDSGSGH